MMYMDGNTRIGLTDEMLEHHRQSIKIWFRGQVMTIGNAEEILIHEEIQRQIDEQGLSHESQIEPFRFSPAFHYEFKMLADRTWQHNYLRSINWDPWQKDKRVKEAE